jgi:hypothetical protein
MRVQIINDICVKCVDPMSTLYNRFIFAPNSVQRNLVWDFTPPTRPIVSGKIITGGELEHYVRAGVVLADRC